MTQQGQGDVVAQLTEWVRNVGGRESTGFARLIEVDVVADAADEITRLRTLLSSSRGEQGWRTIDSAPKDGTWFLICRDDEGYESYEVGCYEPLMHDRYEPADGGLYRKVQAKILDHRGFNNFHRATHWMPLPSPPGSVPTSDTTTINSTLRKLAAVWELDGDLMRCRGCGRALIASLNGEALHHSAECKHSERVHPWVELRNTLGAVPTSLAGQVPDGYVLVPKEPTEVMINEAQMALDDQRQYLKGDLRNVRDALRRAIAAAPQPTAGGDAPTEPRNTTHSLDTFAAKVEFVLSAASGHPDHWSAYDRNILHIAQLADDALSAERARVIELETALKGAIANLEHVSVFDEADDDDQEAIGARSAWQRDLDRFRAALRALGQQDTGGSSA